MALRFFHTARKLILTNCRIFLPNFENFDPKTCQIWKKSQIWQFLLLGVIHQIWQMFPNLTIFTKFYKFWPQNFQDLTDFCQILAFFNIFWKFLPKNLSNWAKFRKFCQQIINYGEIAKLSKKNPKIWQNLRNLAIFVKFGNEFFYIVAAIF